MVLQRDQRIPVWGTAAAGAEVHIRFNHQTVTAVADAHGKWKGFLPVMPANATGQSLMIFEPGRDTLSFKEVLVGEVWLCSGQSNMRMEMAYRNPAIAGVEDWQNEIKKADYPQLRFYNRFRKPGATPWEICDSNSVKLFSAVAYYFGKEILEELKVPVGLIHQSAGGTSIQKWIPEAYFSELEWADQYLKYSQYFPWYEAASCYNNFISPLAGYAIQGVLWYQGESNAKLEVHAYSYRYLLPLLIRSWRKEWGQEDLPFAFVQLPLWDKSIGYRYIREAQLHTLRTVPHTGMAVTYDQDEYRDNLHPGNKRHIGRRLAHWALSDVYKSGSARFSTLVPDRFSQRKDTFFIHFDRKGSGIKKQDKQSFNGFVIAGEDRDFKPAVAIRVSAHKIAVSSPTISKPAAVRYTWGENITPGNLIDDWGRPVTPFRTDAWGNEALEEALLNGEELQLLALKESQLFSAQEIADWRPAPRPARTSVKSESSVVLESRRPGRAGLESPYLMEVDPARNPVVKISDLHLEQATSWTLQLIPPSKVPVTIKKNGKETGDITISLKDHFPQHDISDPSNPLHDFAIRLWVENEEEAGRLSLKSIEIVYAKK